MYYSIITLTQIAESKKEFLYTNKGGLGISNELVMGLKNWKSNNFHHSFHMPQVQGESLKGAKKIVKELFFYRVLMHYNGTRKI